MLIHLLFQMNRIRIEDFEQLFSLFEQVITDFPEESKDEEEFFFHQSQGTLQINETRPRIH